jgi:hypothetical protein
MNRMFYALVGLFRALDLLNMTCTAVCVFEEEERVCFSLTCMRLFTSQL